MRCLKRYSEKEGIFEFMTSRSNKKDCLTHEDFEKTTSLKTSEKLSSLFPISDIYLLILNSFGDIPVNIIELLQMCLK